MKYLINLIKRNRMKNIIKSYWLLSAAVLAMMTLASCDKDDDLEVGVPKRMFTPASDIKTTSGETSVFLSWHPSLHTSGMPVTYTVEVAADTLFETEIVYTTVTDTAGVTITDEDIQVRTPYFARVKANAYGNSAESGWLVSSRFSIRGEQIFLPLGDVDVTDEGALLSWRESAGIDKIVVVAIDIEGEPVGASTTFDLDEADILNGQKLIIGLEPETRYRAEIFAGENSKGTITFTTKEELEEGVIDLTGITDRPSVLQDTLSQIDAGSVVILKKGVTYTIDATTALDRSVKIMSEVSFEPGKAIIDLTSTNFDLVEGSSIDFIEFENLELIGNGTGNYVFNIDKAGEVGEISFEGCVIRAFRGVTRIKTGGVFITDFQFNNSVIKDVLGFGVVNIDHAGSRVDNIKITNSTIYKVERIFISKAASNSILIDNCTFNQAPQATRYLVDYNGVDVTNGVEINNSIFGIGLGDPDGDGEVKVKGVRTGNGLVSSSNTYSTSDYVSTGNHIPDLKPYAGTSEDLFVDPANGNFTIKDDSFEGKDTAGDPTRDRSE